MKLFLKIFFIINLSSVIALDSFAISNYQIFRICRVKKREKECIKRLKLIRELINQGKPIEVPVFPYKAK
tara:strand:+ start:503 stop:712 length:210 start_codon:yes stop_codon:yes gene_type:complete